MILGIPIALFALYGLAGFVFLPYFAHRYLPGYLNDRFGLNVAIEQFRFNPFLFTAEARELAFEDANAQRIASVGRLTADVEFRSLFTKAWTISDARVAEAELRLDIGPDGQLNLATLSKPGSEAESPAKASGAQRRLTWEQVAITESKIAFVHRGYGAPLVYDIEVKAATAHNIAPASAEPIGFSADMRVTQGGALEASGTIAQDFSAARAQVRLAELALKPLQPLLSKYATLTLASGNASAQADVQYQRDGAPKVRAKGGLTIARVALDEPTGDRLLSWNNLSAQNVALGLAPASFRVHELQWDEPVAKIEISKDRKLNLTKVTRDRDAEEAARSTFAAHVDWLHVRGGTVDFSDASLVFPFATKVHRFNGAIAGISSEPGARAELKLEGLIEDSGAAKAEGVLNAFDPTTYTDIRIQFENVKMPTLSPYSATFAGRTIESGRLWLDLDYEIVQGKLDAENKIVMQELALGERVAAPSAFDLPLDLAIALLTDSEGRISMAIPVSGDVNHPEFGYGRVIGAAVVAALKRIVTAPVRALARAFGRESAGADGIDFEPGRTRLMPPERDKLDDIAKALRARPKLKLVVQAPYDPKLDGYALREDAARRELAKLIGHELKRTDNPAPIPYGDAKTQRSLEQLFEKYAGDEAARALVKDFTQTAGREPQRVNRVLTIVGRASPDREFYEAMFDQLVREYPLPDTAPDQLAQRRAETIVDYLTRTAGVDAARVETGDQRAVRDPAGQAVTAKLSVNVLRRSS